MIIDATNLVLGRMASFAAKKALLGEKIEIVNAEKAVIIGKKKGVVDKYKQRVRRGHPYSGPFFPVKPDLIVKRTVRGMLPHKQEKGRSALKNVRCYIGVPKEFENKAVTIDALNVMKKKTLNYITIKDLSKNLR